MIRWIIVFDIYFHLLGEVSTCLYTSFRSLPTFLTVPAIVTKNSSRHVLYLSRSQSWHPQPLVLGFHTVVIVLGPYSKAFLESNCCLRSLSALCLLSCCEMCMVICLHQESWISALLLRETLWIHGLAWCCWLLSLPGKHYNSVFSESLRKSGSVQVS